MERAGNPGSNPGGRTKLERCNVLRFCSGDCFPRQSLFIGNQRKRKSSIMMMNASRMDRETKVQELVEMVARFRDSRDWRKYDTPRNLADSICIEAAELLEHFQWKTDEQAAEMLRSPEKLSEISNELADVIIYCLGFSDILRIDVSNAVQRKLQRNAEKYPARRSKISTSRSTTRRNRMHRLR